MVYASEVPPEHVTDSEIYYRGAASWVCLIKPLLWLVLSLILALVVVRLVRAGEHMLQKGIEDGLASAGVAEGNPSQVSSSATDIIDWVVVIAGWAIVLQGTYFLLKRIWRWLSTRYTLTNDRIEVEEGILGKRIENIELWRVKELDYVRNVVEFFFGIGRLRVGFLDQGNRVLLIGPLAGAREIYEQVKQARLKAGRKAGAQAVGTA